MSASNNSFSISAQRAYFIADLHLRIQDQQKLLGLKHLVERISKEKADLYILGDFFDMWLGDDAIDANITSLLTPLKKLSQQGSRIYLMHGNRDFLIGKQCCAQMGATLMTHDEQIIEHHGERIVLLHGDTLCTDDVNYQKLRSVVRHQDWQQELLAKPLTERIKIAQTLRNHAQAELKDKADEIMDVKLETTLQRFVENHVITMIHGHTHRPQTHQYEQNSKTFTRWVLGDWHHHHAEIICSTPAGIERIIWQY